ncbi:hypothetical protein BV22DRAFT_689362 [Leucogyrophana mollusca]|uniref:Uncharacterized protein n=1 Tax=Leucogyrophana mollusca TaxID=85980 RepID=A0ACB8B9T1_9AGAM|nr:hypothetical protein BV22DRAFT_689362 [Leucogyrophana mollusca]
MTFVCQGCAAELLPYRNVEPSICLPNIPKLQSINFTHAPIPVHYQLSCNLIKFQALGIPRLSNGQSLHGFRVVIFTSLCGQKTTFMAHLGIIERGVKAFFCKRTC